MTIKDDKSRAKKKEQKKPSETKDGGGVNDDDDDDDKSFDAEAESDRISATPTRRGEFPNAFYCPITKELFDHPVVASDGLTYEKSAIQERDGTSNTTGTTTTTTTATISDGKYYYYPNRALEEVMDDRMATTGSSVRASMVRLQKSMRQSMKQLMGKSAIPSEEYRPLPDAYYGPITFELIHVPVIDPEGNTFEKAAIVHWIKSNGNSPITRTTLAVEDLYPNTIIRYLMADEAGKGEDSIHPSIRKWRASDPPDIPDVETGSANSASGSLPTTQVELEQRRRGRSTQSCTMLGIFFLLIVTFALVLYVPGAGFLLLILCLWSYRSTRNNRRGR